MKKFNKKGFTIVELVIVIAVIAILAAVLIPTFSSVVNKANYSAAEQSARNAITAGLQMTSNAALPEGTKIFVDSDKNGAPDYVFNYKGNGMESDTLYQDDGATVVSTIFNSASKGTDNAALPFNNILVNADYVKTKYIDSADIDVVSGKTYYTKGEGEVYTKVENPTKANIETYFVSVIELDSVIVNNLNKLTGNAAAFTCDEDSATITVKGTGEDAIKLTVFTSTDMPANAFVLVRL